MAFGFFPQFTFNCINDKGLKFYNLFRAPPSTADFPEAEPVCYCRRQAKEDYFPKQPFFHRPKGVSEGQKSEQSFLKNRSKSTGVIFGKNMVKVWVNFGRYLVLGNQLVVFLEKWHFFGLFRHFFLAFSVTDFGTFGNGSFRFCFLFLRVGNRHVATPAQSAAGQAGVEL